VLDVIVDGNQLDDSHIFHQLREIRQTSLSKQSDFDIGLLTSLPRDDWASIREYMTCG
jgi:hypothetical protein